MLSLGLAQDLLRSRVIVPNEYSTAIMLLQLNNNNCTCSVYQRIFKKKKNYGGGGAVLLMRDNRYRSNFFPPDKMVRFGNNAPSDARERCNERIHCSAICNNMQIQNFNIRLRNGDRV